MITTEKQWSLIHKISYVNMELILRPRIGLSKYGALLCLNSYLVGSCLIQIKNSIEKLSLTLAITWLGTLSTKIAPRRAQIQGS